MNLRQLTPLPLPHSWCFSVQDESSTAAPVITLPSISEDEEEEDDEDNNNDLNSKKRPKPVRIKDDNDDEASDVRGNTQLSPLLTQFNREQTSSDWLASRGRMPNGHIGAVIGWAKRFF